MHRAQRCTGNGGKERITNRKKNFSNSFLNAANELKHPIRKTHTATSFLSKVGGGTLTVVSRDL